MFNDISRPDKVLSHLRQAILTGRFKPGDRLIEQEIAEEIATSRGPVRDALRHLEQEGLVQIYRNRGAMVSTLGPRQAFEFYLVRGHLEGLAVRLARDYFTDADLRYLDSLVANMRRLRDHEADWLPAIELDLAFHRHIVSCSHNQALIEIYGAMDAKVGALFMTVKQHLARSPTVMPGLHQRVVDVFRAGDWWRVEAVVVDHWHETAANFRHVDVHAEAEAEDDE
ncbi:MAG: GntR family transcriptional regulator [Oscillochloris sp.]|nr:GntR family transcriptional regulator [Oscillochloris sp.]